VNISRNFFSSLASIFQQKNAASPSAQKPVIPPVDLDIPVTNPRLVAAIQKRQIAQTNESATELFQELKASVFLVAVILEKPPTKVADTQVLFKKGDKISVVEVRDANDDRLLALFTDHPELQRFASYANSTLVMPTKDAMAFVLDKGYAGMVVNPANEGPLRLDTPFIRSVIGNM
jgi:hypothetical protein